MAGYKVPQDVEAEDHLIGPFSFRQFIYLIIVAIAMFIAWLLGQIFIGLAVIPLPVIIFFGALALPLRKDQPMETYLAAVVRYYLKPKQRLWSSDGSLTMVTITAPKDIEHHLTKDFTGDEAQERLSYLAQIVDTKGWASRGFSSAPTSLNDTYVAEARNAHDVLDEGATLTQSFEDLISRQDIRRRQVMMDDFQRGMQAQPPAQTTPATVAPSRTATSNTPQFDPYPSSMHQHVLQPASSSPQDIVHQVAPPVEETPAQTIVAPVIALPSPKPVSPDIIRLANNNDLSISAIAHEAHRLEERDDEEVVISLR